MRATHEPPGSSTRARRAQTRKCSGQRLTTCFIAICWATPRIAIKALSDASDAGAPYLTSPRRGRIANESGRKLQLGQPDAGAREFAGIGAMRALFECHHQAFPLCSPSAAPFREMKRPPGKPK
jgi:hypothetical protein